MPMSAKRSKGNRLNKLIYQVQKKKVGISNAITDYFQFGGSFKMDNEFWVDVPTINFKTKKVFDIDADKIETLEDVKVILGAMKLRISEDFEDIDKIRHLLKESE